MKKKKKKSIKKEKGARKKRNYLLRRAAVSLLAGDVSVLPCHCVYNKLLVVIADHSSFPTFPSGKGTGGDCLLPEQLSPFAESENRTLLPQTSLAICCRHRLALQCLYTPLTHENARKRLEGV